MNYTLISKGKYTSLQTPNFVSVSRYLYIKEGGKKYLILKLTNDCADYATAIKVSVRQKNARGEEIGVVTAESSHVDGRPFSRFVFPEKILLDDRCADFEVKIATVEFGNYVYKSGAYGPVVSYKKKRSPDIVERSFSPSAHTKSPGVSVRTFKAPAIICVISLFMIVASIFFTYFQLKDFVSASVGFTLSGVEYAFTDSDKTDDSDVYVTGYRGLSRHVVIPEYVGNHKVVSIDQKAFINNTYIDKLTIKGEYNIETNAFEGCTNLSSVTLEKATKLGAYAFRGCAKLKEFVAYNLDTIGEKAFKDSPKLTTVLISNENKILTIGEEALASCPSLATVKIDQWIDYKGQYNFLKDSRSVATLMLKNFNHNSETVKDRTDNTIRKLFGVADDSQRALSINDLEITYIDRVPSKFCMDIPVARVKLENLKIAELGDDSFSGCTKLAALETTAVFTKVGTHALSATAITMFDGSKLLSVGDYAFAQCSALQSVDMGTSSALIELGKGAFQNCTSLQRFTMPATIAAIKDETFQGCKQLQQITVVKGSTLNTIGASAFSGCEVLEKAPLVASLIEIGASAFESCKALTSVTIPDSVVSVGLGAFQDCSAIEELTVPFVGETSASNTFLSYIFGGSTSTETMVPASLRAVTVTSITEIGTGAFYGCGAIQEINLPDGVARIGKLAFYGCKKLDQFVVPSAVTEIGDSAFENCFKLYELYNLSNLEIKRNSPDHGMVGYYAVKIYQSESDDKIPKVMIDGFEFARTEEGDWYLINFKGDQTALSLPKSIAYQGNTINTYQVIRYMMTEHATVVSITVPSSVANIGEYAFGSCSSLKTVIVEKGVSSIGIGAFFNCQKLTDITVPFIGESSTQNRYLSHVFGAPNPSTSLFVSKSLTSVHLTDSVDIPDDAFSGFAKLMSVTSDNKIGSIGARAFLDCVALTTPPISDGLTSIGDRAFKNCVAMKQFELPSTVKFIGFGAFVDCTGLAEITVPFIGARDDSGECFAYIFGTSNPQYGNSVPLSLKTVTVLRATQVTTNAFYGCNTIETISLPPNLTKIGDRAFYLCSALQGLEVQGGLVSIGSQAFYGCAALAQFEMQSGLNSIGSEAFYGCASLKSVVVPDSVASIGNGAFSQCEQLADITIPFVGRSETENRYFSYIFGATYYYDSNYVPSSLKTVTVTKERSIPQYAFYSCVDLTTVNLPDTVAKIGQRAFEQCLSLKSMRLPEHLSMLGEYAFSNCSALESVEFSDYAGLSTIPSGAFSNCLSLKSIKLPYSVTTISSHAFSASSEMESVVLPSALMSIGQSAFENCVKLYEVYYPGTRLNIEKGSAAHGYVAYYAIVVHKSLADEPLQEVSIDGVVYKHSGDNWAVVGYESNTNLSNLKLGSFSYQGKTISSYSVKRLAFAYCESLKTLTIGNEVTAIEEGAFRECVNLTSVIYESYSIPDIRHETFAYCSSLQKLTLPSSLTRIDAFAFMGCGKLLSITIPDRVSAIGDQAFYDCRSLYDVRNLSRYLTVKKGSTGNGYIGYYALRVTANASSTPLETTTVNGLNFFLLDGQWYLYGVESNDSNLKLPEKFTFNGKTVTSYIVLESAFSQKYLNSLYVPLSVSKILRVQQFYDYFTLSRVYYSGTSAQWSSLVGNLYDSPFSYCEMFYYSKCVHEYGQWTYVNGEISTEKKRMTYEVTTEPTCQREGAARDYCPDCGLSYHYVLQVTDHKLVNGTCTYCKKKEVVVSASNFGNLAELSNSYNYPFEIDSQGTIRSTNHDHYSSSTLVFQAQRTTTIHFNYWASSEAYRDVFEIRVNGSTVKDTSGTSGYQNSYSVTLRAGEMLEFSYIKDGSGSKGDDCGYISDLRFIS